MSGPLQAVMLERALQDAKWGEQNHDDPGWLLILMEEVGEVAEEILPFMVRGDPFRKIVKQIADVGARAQKAIGEACYLGEQDRTYPAVHHEAIQITAVGFAWLECMERRKAKMEATR